MIKRVNIRNVWTIVVSLAMIATTSAQAAAVIYEPFNYATGGLNGKGGTTEIGLTNTWSANASANVVPSSLTYGTLSVSGGSIGNLNGGSNNYGGTRSISASALVANGLLNDGATLWFSVLMGYGAGGNLTNSRLAFSLANSNFSGNNYSYYIVNEGPQLGSGLGATLGRFSTNGRIVATQFRDSTFGTSGVSGNVFGTEPSSTIGAAQQRLVIGKITWGASSDTIELYEPDTSLSLGSVKSTLTVNVDQSTYDVITWARGDVVTMDEIRFGASYADVVPIPAGAPVTASLSPTNAAVNVSKSANLVATFNKPVRLTGSGTVTITNLTLATAEVINLPDARVTITDSTYLTINPSANLATSAQYAVLFSNNAVEDYTSLAFDGISETNVWTFTATSDATAPAITDTNPADGANGGIFTPLRATFSENVLFTGTGTIKVRNVTLGSDIQTYTLPNANVNISSNVLTILSTVRRTTNTTYAVQISSNAIEDFGGNAFAGTADETSWNFTTLSTVNYEWSGATDANWNNPANWNANGVPIDSLAGGSLELYSGNGERIVFNVPLSSNPVPTSNIPALGGEASGSRDYITPQLDVKAGTITFSALGYGSQGLVRDTDYPWTMTVGDGDTDNGSASLTLNGGFTSGINRDQTGAMVWTIKADGTVTMNAAGTVLIFGYDTGRPANFILNGGSFTTTDELDMLQGSTAYGTSYIEFNGKSSTFTAKFGTDFPNLASVIARCGDGLTFRSTVGALRVTDNGNTTFTVSVAPPSGTVIQFK
jgi:hypothetical protein